MQGGEGGSAAMGVVDGNGNGREREIKSMGVGGWRWRRILEREKNKINQ